MVVHSNDRCWWSGATISWLTMALINSSSVTTKRPSHGLYAKLLPKNWLAAWGEMRHQRPKVQKNCARSRMTATREICVALGTDRAQLINHITPVPSSFRRSHLDNIRPIAYQVGSASQRPSFGFLPSLKLPEYSAPALHDSATPSRKPFHPLCGVEPAPPAHPKLAALRQSARARKLCVCGSLPSRIALDDYQPPGHGAPLPLHSGRHAGL